MMDSSSDEEDIALSELAKTLKCNNFDEDDNIPLKKMVNTSNEDNIPLTELAATSKSDNSMQTVISEDANAVSEVKPLNNNDNNDSNQNCFSDVINQISSHEFTITRTEENDATNVNSDYEITGHINQEHDYSSGLLEIDSSFNVDEMLFMSNQSDRVEISTLEISGNGQSENLDVLFPLFENIFQTESVEDVVSIQVEIPGNSEIVYTSENEGFTENSNKGIVNYDTETSLASEAITDNDTDITQTPTYSEDENEGPVRERRSRRRTRNLDQWKQSIRKRKRNSGEEYVSARGKKVCRREIKRPKCRCKFKCTEKISDDDQAFNFHEYWKLSYGGQRDFIREHVRKVEKRRSTTDRESRRKNTYEYYLCNRNDNNKQRVCKVFFLQSLSIGERTVVYTMNRKERIRCEDKRGRKDGVSKIPEADKEYIRNHISSFPVVESHYCRKSTQRKYLEKSLSIRKMYDLYKEKCESDGRNPQKYWLYDQIFAKEFNLGFHRPKKDLCAFCDSYSKLPDKEKENLKDDYKKHIYRKEQARENKNRDKEIAETNEKVQVLNFDLQKVLITPKLSVSDAYYCRKLATYNFTIYDMITRQVSCNIWWESEAKRGSCEISTCLYLQNRDAGAKDEIIFYSDSCPGQQRNLPFSIMCLYCVVNLPINKISHNYFERGHSQMEGDSVHANIERETKLSEIYCPADWMTAIKNTKKTDPKYKVVQISHDAIIDFKECADKIVTNRNKDDNNDIVRWNKIRCFQYRKETPDKIFFKYDYAEEYKGLSLARGRKKTTPIEGYKLKSLYKSCIPISDLKYRDLQSMCKKMFIPRVYHQFYNDLPHSKKSDRLPEPNEDDSDDSD